MLVKVRKGIFETNSSSAHSLIVTKSDNEYLTKKEIKDYHYGRVFTKTNPFYLFQDKDIYGRAPFSIIYNCDSKLDYVLASLHNLPDIYNTLQIFSDYTGIKNFEITSSENKILNSFLDEVPCIDDGSDNLIKNFMKKTGYTIKDIIFNKSIKIIIDGDEYNIFSDMMKNKIINTNNLKYYYNGYILKKKFK
jgi:hypothetical protein